MKWFGIIWVIFPGLLLIGCDKKLNDPEEVIVTQYQYNPPLELNDGIEVSSLNNEGLKDIHLRIMMDSIHAGAYGKFNSFLVFYRNKLVFEEYFNGWTLSDHHPMWSVTKSITSAVIGIALEQGKISGVDQTIYSLLSHIPNITWTEQHKQITLEHYLTMTSGYEWKDFDNGISPDNPENSYMQMLNSGDWLKYVIELPLVADPGTKFKYNNGTSTVLSVLVSDAVVENFDAYAHNNLFSHLGVVDYHWAYLPGGFAGTAGNDGGVFLTPRDMAKFGLLYLNGGSWNGDQIVRSEWVATSTEPHITIKKNENIHFSYGYQWWLNERLELGNGKSISVPYAVGHGGQYIFLIKDYDMMVVITSPYENPDRTTLDVFQMLVDFVLASVEK